jgi:NAD(P)-dependent dehydrogenase (short-subunit alcohol dehydrogenase family)
LKWPRTGSGVNSVAPGPTESEALNAAGWLTGQVLTVDGGLELV